MVNEKLQKRRNIKMKKIGLLCMALVLALGMLGVGYAMWKDEVTIEGTVSTGTVEVDIVELSETYVYKNITPNAAEPLVMSPVPLVGTDLMLVASATADDVSQPGGPKEIEMTFTNIFPTPTAGPIEADVMLHYNGTVPAHVALVTDAIDPALAPYLIQTWLVQVAPGQWVEQSIDGIQLHQCNSIWLIVSLNATALQEDGKEAQGLQDLTFTKTIVVHQWNEPYPP
jgi:hypothetical protein